jgi:hypothetical protein
LNKSPIGHRQPASSHATCNVLEDTFKWTNETSGVSPTGKSHIGKRAKDTTIILSQHRFYTKKLSMLKKVAEHIRKDTCHKTS